jgi:hypothetical protein
MSRIIREARPTDVAEIMQVMDAAKGIMRQSGNMHQWGDGYPSEVVITADMERNGGCLFLLLLMLWHVQPVRSTLKHLPYWNKLGQEMRKELAK